MKVLVRQERTEWSVEESLQLAWITWGVLLVLPFVVFLGVLIYLLASSEPPNPKAGQLWFLIACGWLIVIAPLAFWLRDRIFRVYWTGKTVAPKNYFWGMLVIWMTFEIGGLLSLLGCFAGRSLMPNMLPAAAAFVLFTPFWPGGRAMSSQVGKSDDAEIFRHPN